MELRDQAKSAWQANGVLYFLQISPELQITLLLSRITKRPLFFFAFLSFLNVLLMAPHIHARG